MTYKSFHKYLKTVISVLGQKNIKDIFFADKYMIATNGIITVKVRLSQNTENSFKLPINIAVMLQSITDENITITNNDQYIKFIAKDKDYKTEFKAVTNEEVIPKVDLNGFAHLITLSFVEFKQKVASVLSIAKTSPISGYISGVCLTSKNGCLKIISGNKYCLALDTSECSSSISFNFSLSEKSIGCLLKANFEGTVKIMRKNNHIAFVVENFVFFTDEIQPNSINIDNVYQKYLDCSAFATVERKTFLSAVKCLYNTNSKQIQIKVKGNNMLINANDMFNEKIVLNNEYLAINAIFNINYIYKALKALKGKNIIIHYYNTDCRFITLTCNSTVWIIAEVFGVSPSKI